MMNRAAFYLFVFFYLTNPVLGQIKPADFKIQGLKSKYLSDGELKGKFNQNNFSHLWTKTENRFVYGFIGENYQRIRIKFISVKKDSTGMYIVRGKSMVKNNICEFAGVINITNIRRYKQTSYGVDNEWKSKGIVGQYAIIGNYTFKENSSQPHPGTFKGIFKTGFYLFKGGKFHYDDIDLNADSFVNNEFVGTWIGDNSKITKTCNWGDYRVPNAKGLDGGAGEFSPNDKYLPLGWQSVCDVSSNNARSVSAKKEENRIWWK